jgi:hypothetical protein
MSNVNDKPTPVFTKEMVKVVEHIISQNKMNRPKDKLCLIWLMNQQQRNPKLVCFRKVLQDQKAMLQMNSSENPKEFEGIIDANKGQWVTIIAPDQIEKKLAPLLQTLRIDTKRVTKGERLMKLYRPHLNAWSRYLEAWKNGKNMELLERYGKAITSGVPFVLMGKCYDKLGSWIHKIRQS